MSSYRLYVLEPEERITDTREAEFCNDEDALAQAVALRNDSYAVEVWTGERLVGRLGAEFTIEL